MPPRLLVNAKWRSHTKTTGVQRYAEGLCRAMQDRGIEFDTLNPPSQSRWRSMIWEQRTLPSAAEPYQALLCPANMAPVQLDEQISLLAVIHCLRFRFHPEDYSSAFTRWYAFMIPRIIERADTVFTVSRAQQAEIEAVYPQAIGKVELLLPGVNAAFHPDQEPDSATPDSPYLVFMGSSTPAKNLRTLLSACAMGPDLPPLVLLGVDEREADLICPDGIRNRIVPLGHINEPTRVARVLANARALLAPSRYESFGLPCLEAMACGTPVIASDLPAHREVCQSVAVYAHPSEPDAWRAAMDAVVGDTARLKQMSTGGQVRARAYNWANAVKVLRQVLDRQSPAAVR